jgi:uncharacterized membrane protein
VFFIRILFKILWFCGIWWLIPIALPFFAYEWISGQKMADVENTFVVWYYEKGSAILFAVLVLITLSWNISKPIRAAIRSRKGGVQQNP